MGIFSWFWEFFGRWFSGGTRYGEEIREAGIEKRELKITRTEEELERFEKRQLKLIKAELQNLYSGITKRQLPNNQIKSGNQMITLDQCIMVLMQYVDGLIANKVSISQEVQMFGNIKLYWSAARSGMAGIISEAAFSQDKKFKKAAGGVNKFMKDIGKLFAGLAKELNEEDELSRAKIDMIKRQYALVMQEEGTGAPAAAPRQVNPSAANQQIRAAQQQTRAAGRQTNPNRTPKLKPAMARV
mgnify:FL=1